MAQQRPGHDPATVTAAMSAIEEALNLSSEASPNPNGSRTTIGEPAQTGAPLLEIKLPHVDHANVTLKPVGEPVSAPPEPVSAKPSSINLATPPANDDRKVAGQIVQAMQIRASNWPMPLALIASMLWLALVAYYILRATSLEPFGNIRTVVDNVQFPSWLLLGLGPVIFFFLVAALVRRVQEIRLSAHSMSTLAMRLVEPEAMATEQVVTISQAIRREVASMGDGIERALARASELETMVRTEVSNLERSYTDNERRIRILVDGLASEREAIVSYSDRVRAAIGGAHDKMSQGLEEISRSLSERVQTVGDTVTSSLSTKGDEIFVNLNATNDAFLQKLSSQSNVLTDRVSQTRDEIAKSIDSRIEDIDAHLRKTGAALATEFVGIGDSLAERMGTTGKQIAENILSYGQNLTAQMTETSILLDTTIGEKGESLVQKLAETGDNLSELLVRRTQETQEVFTATGEALTAKLDEHQTHIQLELTRQSSVLTDHFVQTSQHALASMSEHADLIQQNLTTTVEHTAQVLNAHSTDFAERFRSTTDLALEAIESQTAAFEQQITRTTDQNSAILKMQGDSLQNTYQQVVGDTITKLAVQGEELGSLLTSLDAKLSDTAGQSAAAILAHSEAFRMQYEQTIESAIASFADEGEAFNTKFIGTAENVLVTFADRADILDQNFAQTANEAMEAIGTQSERITTTIAERLNQFEENVLTNGNALADRVISGADRITHDVDQKLVAVEAAFTVHGTNFINELESRTHKTAEQLEAQIVEFEQRASSKSQEISHSLDTLIAKIDAGLDARSHALNDMLAHRAVDVAKVLGEGGREVTRALDAKATEIDQILLFRSTALTETLSSKAEEINNTLGGKATEIASTLDHRISVFEDRIVNRLDAVSTELNQRGQSVASILHERGRDIEAMLEAQSSALNTGTVTIRELLEHEGLGLVKALSERGGDVSREIAEIGDLVIRAIELRGSAIVAQLTHQQSELTEAIDSSSSNLRSNIEVNAASTISTLVETNNKVHNDLTALLAELDQRNQTLKTISGDATQNLSLMEYNLGARVKEFDAALNLVKQQIVTLAQTSTSTLNGAQNIAEKLYMQGKNLAETSDNLVRSQKDSDMALETRIVSLESLLSRVQERSHDLTQIIHNFTDVIGDSVKEAEIRARDIGSFMLESTQSIENSIGQQFEAIRTTTGKERERTASVMRETYDQAKVEMEEIFAGTAERFKSSTEELLAMSNAIRHELEATREELRRSTAELPQETIAQTANLRRIVADQVNALNELTDIATRSGRSVDIAGPETPPSRRVPEPAPKMRAPEPPRLPEPPALSPRPSAPRIAEPPQMEAPQRPMSKPMSSLREDFLRARAPAPPPPPQMRPMPLQAAPVEPSVQAERGAGWLSDLLNRASQDETSASMRSKAPPVSSPQSQPTGSLDAISLDIARMIDHNTAISMWDRYRNGERKVFSHRLYTQQGQNTFDEIRRRYRSDAEFRETVNRYIAEFERLDSEMSRTDREGNLTRAFLVSDTGKVYTMLAHAAGRLD